MEHLNFNLREDRLNFSEIFCNFLVKIAQIFG